MENLDDCLSLWQSVLLTAITDFRNGKGEHGVNYQAGLHADGNIETNLVARLGRLKEKRIAEIQIRSGRGLGNH